MATATKRGGLAATKRGGRGGRRAAADERRRGRCNDLTISHDESWASGGGKQRNNQLTYVNERDSSGRKQREQMKETR